MEQARTLAQVISALPEEERFILTLHLLKNMEPAAIASALGVPEKAVVSVIAQGKARLVALLDFPPPA